jgi:hypothetical protein
LITRAEPNHQQALCDRAETIDRGEDTIVIALPGERCSAPLMRKPGVDRR